MNVKLRSIKTGIGGLLKNKTFRLIAIGLVVVLLGASAAYNAFAPKAVPALAASVQQLSDNFYEDGVVRAKARSIVSADITGKVQSVAAQEGQQVQKGDILCTLDTAELEAERALAQAERDSVLASWEQGREQIKQQIAGLKAQRSSYSTADVSNIYDQQIQLLDLSMDPTKGNSVAWSFQQMINAAQYRMRYVGEDQSAATALRSQLEAAKTQQLSIENQKAQFKAQLIIQLTQVASDPVATADLTANGALVEASYDKMLSAASAQITHLQAQLSMDTGSYSNELALQSEINTLQEQYNAFLYNTKAQILALTAQQEQAAVAGKSASSARGAINDQIDLLNESMNSDSGTASYYATQLSRVDASLAELDRRISLATVVSPMDGVCGAMDVKEGQYISAGSVLTEIVNPEALQVECMLLTEDADSVRPGMRASIIWERRDGDVSYPCTVLSVSTLAVDYVSAVGLLEQRVKAILQPDFTGQTHPGDGFQVRVQFTTEEAVAIAVPRSAVIQSSKGDAVFVLRDNVAVLVPVSLGLESGNMVAVLSGLTEQDIVIENPKAENVQEGKAFKKN